MILDCQNICKAFGTDVILDNISFHLEEKEKMAIVGINGAGKTTLLKIIMGEESADSGQVIVSKDRTIGYLSQYQESNYNTTVRGVMMDALKPILELQDRMRELEHTMAEQSGEELEKSLELYNRYTHEFEYKNGYSCESEANGVLKGLGFSKEDYDRHTDSLSGGQRTRLALGRLLMVKPDIIILDEPTNHLDMESISWLEGFLSSYQGSVIIVSHDRYFLDKIVTRIVELDNGHSQVYNGNYTYFAQKRAEIRENMMKAYLNQQQEIKHQEEVITKLKQFNREKSIKRAESREKMLEDTKLRMSLDDLYSQIQSGNLKELNLIIKADVAGSVEAVKQSLLKLSNEEVVVKCIHGGVGAINESDVSLASASNAIIIGFNVRPDATAKSIAEREKVDVRLYKVIYQAIEDVEAAMKGMLDPVFEEKVIGHAVIRQLFKASGVGTIAGSYVLDGKFQRGCSCRITREGEQIYDGPLASLKRFKDDVKEVAAGYECGLVFEKFNDLQEDDQIEAYMMVEVPR